MSQTIFKSSVQPLQNGSPFHSRSISQTYHVPQSFSPKFKENASKPDYNKTNSQTHIKKLSFLLSPGSDNPMKSDDERTPKGNSIVSFHTPSKGSGDTSKKFIQLKGSTSSNQLGFEIFNSKDLVRLAMSKAKTKETTKKDRVRTPNNMSNIFKKPQNMHGSGIFAGADKTEDLTHSFSSTVDHENGAFRGARPSTSDKAAKMRRLNQIYKEGSPADNRTRQAHSIMYGGSNDVSHQFFHHSLSPTNHSVSKLLSPNNMTVALSSDVYKLSSHSSSTRNKANQDDMKSYKSRDEEYLGQKTPIAETSSDRYSQLKKVPSASTLKINTTSVNKFSFFNAPMGKERGRSPNSRMRKIKLPFENNEDTFGRRNQKSSNGESLSELENAVNNLVRTCEQSLEPHPRNKNAAEKMRLAQENLLERIRCLAKNDDGSQINLETVLKEKKAIEEELSAVKEENEQLRVKMNEMCQRFKNNKMKSGKEKSDFVENVPSTKGETSETGRPTSLRKIINHQQRVIQDLKKKEGVVKKVLDMIKHTGMNVDDFSSSDNYEDENQEGCSVPVGSTSDLNEGKLTESDQMEQVAFTWNMESGEVREIIEKNEKPARSVIRIQNIDQQGEITNEEDDDKMISEFRESEIGSVRHKLVKPTYSDAKSTADSAGFSTRKQTKGRRSLSSKLKNKLKLDLTRVTGSMSVPKYNIVSGQSSNDKFMLNFPAESGKGFHEEFMSRFEEFSQSWRQAALHQKF